MPQGARSRIIIWAFLVCGVLVAVQGNAPDPTPAPDTHAPEECGVCTVPDCAFDTYSWDKLSWFEHNCREFTSDQTQRCIGYIATISHYKEPHEHEHEIPYVIITIFASFALGAIVRHLFKDTPVPYTVIMFLIGIAWGRLSTVEGFGLSSSVEISSMNPHLIFHIFLPVLIFESAFAMEIPVFKKVMWQCVLFAGPGLIIASVLTGTVAKYWFTDYDWNWYACLLFGTILSATDPVAVVALLKDLGASPLISTMIEGESLFNDGTAIVFFTLLVEAIQVKSCNAVDWDTCVDQCVCETECKLDKEWWEMILTLLKFAVGGPVVGLIIGAITVQALNRVFNDALIEITLTFVAAYLTFYSCEVFFEVSGVLGVVAAGCFLSYYKHCISPEVMHTLHEFWEITVYLVNTLIFTLAGMITALKAFNGVGINDVWYLVITYFAINVIRFFILGLFSPLLRYCFSYKLTFGSGVLVAWGGLRGAVGLALALIVQADDNVAVDNVREKFVFITAGIVILTLCVNGVSTQLVVKYFNLDEIEEGKKKRIHDAWNNLLREQDQDFIDLGSEPLLYDTNWNQVSQFASMRLAIPKEMEDPYNKKGWFEKRNNKSTREEVKMKERVEGKAAYLTTVQASLQRQYIVGALRRTGIRNMIQDIDASRDLTEGLHDDDWTKTLIQADWLGKYFHQRGLDKLATTLLSSVPGMHEKLLRDRWSNGFDIALGFIVSHKVCRSKIHDLCERRVANEIETHCKRTNIAIVNILSKKADERPDISCSLKTRTASRNILNSMRQQVSTMRSNARLDAADAGVLNAMITNAEKDVTKNFPVALEHANAYDVLESLYWYQKCKQKSKEDFNNSIRDECRVVDIPSGKALASVEDLQKNVGIVVVTLGIIQIRVGRKIFSYGAGYTAYVNRLLTGHERFSDIWTESAVRLLVMPERTINALLEEDEGFFDAMWKTCGMNTARCLMGIDDAYDPKVWDDKTIRKTAENGHIEMLQDPKLYDDTAERRHKLGGRCHRTLLRGRAWEYGEERDHIGGSLCRFPCLIPGDFKFATFTGHAVFYEMEVPINASQRAKIKWGFLKSKIKSIILWSNLRGKEHGKACLALAFGRTPLQYHPDQSMARQLKQDSPETAFTALEDEGDEGSGESELLGREAVHDPPSSVLAQQNAAHHHPTQPTAAPRSAFTSSFEPRQTAVLPSETALSSTPPDDNPPPSAVQAPLGNPYYQQYSHPDTLHNRPIPPGHSASSSGLRSAPMPPGVGSSPLGVLPTPQASPFAMAPVSSVASQRAYPRGYGAGGASPAPTLLPITPGSGQGGIPTSILPSAPYTPLDTVHQPYSPEYPAMATLGRGGVLGSPITSDRNALLNAFPRSGSAGVGTGGAGAGGTSAISEGSNVLGTSGFALPPPPDFRKILEDVVDEQQTIEKHASFKKLLKEQAKNSPKRDPTRPPIVLSPNQAGSTRHSQL